MLSIFNKDKKIINFNYFFIIIEIGYSIGYLKKKKKKFLNKKAYILYIFLNMNIDFIIQFNHILRI